MVPVMATESTMGCAQQGIAVLLTKSEVARSIRRSIRTLENLMNSGAIGFVRFGRNVWFRPKDIEEFVERYRVKSQVGKGGSV